MNRRGLATAAIATCAHALLVAWALTPLPAVVPAVGHDVSNEIELETAPSPTDDAPAIAPAAPRAEHAALAPPPRSAHAEPVASSAPASAEPSGAIAGSNGTFIVFGPATGIGDTGRINPFLGRGAFGAGDAGAPAEAHAAGGKRSDSTLADALRANDVAKGLGPEGPVLRALEEATLASAAPIKGGATFTAIVDATGTVIDLRLVSWRGERAGWDDTRERAVVALAAKKLALHGAKGAELQIQVESDLRLPGGASADGLSQKRIVFSLDPSDVGARPMRVVHARRL